MRSACSPELNHQLIWPTFETVAPVHIPAKLECAGRGICAMLFDLNKKISQPLRCPDCDVDMDFLLGQYNSRVFVSTLLEHAFFRCPNCQRLDHRLVAIPRHFIDGTVDQPGVR